MNPDHEEQETFFGGVPDPCVDFDPPTSMPALFGPRGEVLRYRVDRFPAGYRARNPHRMGMRA